MLNKKSEATRDCSKRNKHSVSHSRNFVEDHSGSGAFEDSGIAVPPAKAHLRCSSCGQRPELLQFVSHYPMATSALGDSGLQRAIRGYGPYRDYYSHTQVREANQGK